MKHTNAFTLMGLFLGIVGLVTTQSSFCWPYYVTNSTTSRAVVTLKYPPCREDRREIMPGKTEKFNSGICLLTRIEAKLEEGGDIFIGGRTYRTTDSTTGRTTIVEASPYRSSGTTYENYHITGPAVTPVMERGEHKSDPYGNPLYKSSYMVSRTVQ